MDTPDPRRVAAFLPSGAPNWPSSHPPSTGLATRALLARPFERPIDDGPVLRFSAAHLNRRQRHLVDEGWVAHRVFPNLPELPTFREHREERVVFVTGALHTGATLASLLGRLYAGCRAAPFLAVHDRGRVLMAMLSPVPPPAGRSRPVLATLQRSLNEIEVIREPVDALFAVLDHRYDRLLSVEGDESVE